MKEDLLQDVSRFSLEQLTVSVEYDAALDSVIVPATTPLLNAFVSICKYAESCISCNEPPQFSEAWS